MLTKKNYFIMVDGIDGVGKTLILDTLAKLFNSEIFNLEEYLKENDKYPKFEQIKNYKLIYSSEPSYAPLGKYIRQELVNKEKNYSTQILAQAYALDRNILYENIIIPALQNNINIIQSRGIITSIIYQKISGTDDNFSLEEILNLPGNKTALKYAPDFLIIPYVKDINIALKRIAQRDKKDNAIFEKYQFLEKAQAEYFSDDFKEFCQKHNIKIIYIDNTNTMQETINKVKDFFNEYIK